MLHVLVPHRKRIFIFRLSWTARREWPARFLTTSLSDLLSNLQLALTGGFGTEAIAAKVLMIHYN